MVDVDLKNVSMETKNELIQAAEASEYYAAALDGWRTFERMKANGQDLSKAEDSMGSRNNESSGLYIRGSP